MYCRWYGLTSYGVGLELQEQARKHATEYSQNSIIGLEHESVITLGKRAADIDLAANTSDWPIYRVDRGGQATLHTPGQLVIYPIIRLADYGLSVRSYVELLHQSTEKLFAEFGVRTERDPLAGLHTSKGKIAFIGVRVRQGVSGHGISLNVSNDLSLFQNIRSCGAVGAKIDSLKHQGLNYSTQIVFEEWYKQFRALLSSSQNLTFPVESEINTEVLLSN